MRISDWSSDVCSSDLRLLLAQLGGLRRRGRNLLLLIALAQSVHLFHQLLFGGHVSGFGLGVEAAQLRHLQPQPRFGARSEEHTSELQSLMRISYAVFCLKKKIYKKI